MNTLATRRLQICIFDKEKLYFCTLYTCEFNFPYFSKIKGLLHPHQTSVKRNSTGGFVWKRDARKKMHWKKSYLSLTALKTNISTANACISIEVIWMNKQTNKINNLGKELHLCVLLQRCLITHQLSELSLPQIWFSIINRISVSESFLKGLI